MYLRARAAYLDVWGRVFVLLNALYHVSTYRNTIQIHPYLSLVYNSSSTATMCLRNRIRQTHTIHSHKFVLFYYYRTSARCVLWGSRGVHTTLYILCTWAPCRTRAYVGPAQKCWPLHFLRSFFAQMAEPFC